MNRNNFPAIISTIVLLIMVVAIAIPIISGMSNTISHEKEVETFRYYVDTSADEVQHFYNDNGVVTINDEQLTGSEGSTMSGILFVSENLMFAYATNNFGLYAKEYTGYITADDITINPDGTWTATGHGQEWEGEYGELYFIATNEKTDWVCVHNSLFNIDKNKKMYVANTTSMTPSTGGSNVYSFGLIEGKYTKINELVYCNILLDEAWTNADTMEYVANTDPGVEDKYLIGSTNGRINVSVGDEDYSRAMQVVAYIPATYHTLEDNDKILTTLIDIVPVLLIVGVILAIFGTVYYRKEQ